MQLSPSSNLTLSGPAFHPDDLSASPAAGTTYEMCLTVPQTDPSLLRQLGRLEAAIAEELPPESGGTILFVGVGSAGHVADVAGHAARQLSARGGGRAILVDADAHGKVLTQRFAATMESGLAEALLDGIPPSRHVITTAVPYLDFLPWGRGRISRRATTPVLVRGMVAEWKRCYRYTIVAGGVELTSPVGLFSRYCDATYLVVQLGQAGPASTRAAADTLMAAGARLLGCVATGVRRDKELASGSAGTEWSPLPRGAAA